MEIGVFSIIPSEQRTNYIGRLENTNYVVLEKDEYFNLAGKAMEKEYGLAIRAVQIQEGGHFEVIMSDEAEYSVCYFILGSRVWGLHKTVLIIEADELPKVICADYSIAK